MRLSYTRNNCCKKKIYLNDVNGLFLSMSFKQMRSIPEETEVSIDIENTPICLICLDDRGPFIQSGCLHCKDSNNMIHQGCLDELHYRGYHKDICYVCKQKLPPKTRTCIEYSFCLMAYMIFYIIIGCILKLFFFAILLFSYSNGILIIRKIYNPFENITNAIIQFGFTLLGIIFGNRYIKHI